MSGRLSISSPVLGVIFGCDAADDSPRHDLRTIMGRSVAEYTLAAALRATLIQRLVIVSNCPALRRIGQEHFLQCLPRPEGHDIRAFLREATLAIESRGVFRPTVVVALPADVAVRPLGMIDRCVREVLTSGIEAAATFSPAKPGASIEPDGACLVVRRHALDSRGPLSPRPIEIPAGEVIHIRGKADLIAARKVLHSRGWTFPETRMAA
jgi:hypothetical protein